MMVLGEIQRSLGRLEAGQHANRQATIDQGATIRQRQDDIRRELLVHIDLMHKRLERTRRGLSWLKHMPWDRIAVTVASTLGTLGWIKPQWLAWLRLWTG